MKESFRSYVNDVCTALRNTEIPTRQIWRLEENQRSETFRSQIQIDYHLIAKTAIKISRRLRTYEMLYREIVRNPPTILAGLSYDPINEEFPGHSEFKVYMQILLPFWEEYFQKNAAVSYNEGLFDQLYFELARDWVNNDVRIIDRSPLLNVILDTDRPINLSDNISLTRISSQEIERWVNPEIPNLFDYPSGVAQGLGDFNACLEFSHKWDPDSLTIPETQMDTARSVHQIIQLFANKRIVIPHSERLFNLSILSPKRYTLFANIVSIPRNQDILRIDNATGAKLVDLWTNYQQVRRDSQVGFALRRWTVAMNRDDPEDQIVDHWIGLESLFAQDSNSEVRYRASLRLAIFLGQNAPERRRIYGLAKTTYDWRSAIAHGNNKRRQNLKEASSIRDISVTVGGYLQDVLIKVIRNPNAFRPNELELMMLDQDPS